MTEDPMDEVRREFPWVDWAMPVYTETQIIPHYGEAVVTAYKCEVVE